MFVRCDYLQRAKCEAWWLTTYYAHMIIIIQPLTLSHLLCTDINTCTAVYTVIAYSKKKLFVNIFWPAYDYTQTDSIFNINVLVFLSTCLQVVVMSLVVPTLSLE